MQLCQNHCGILRRCGKAAGLLCSFAKTIAEYYEGAAKLQDYYAAHTPLIALYWDNMMLAHSSRLENVTVDAVFGLNNVNNWFTLTEK